MADDSDDSDNEGDVATDTARLRLVRQVEGQVARATGRVYAIDLAALDLQSLRELSRLLRDLDTEKTAAVRRARITPWRR